MNLIFYDLLLTILLNNVWSNLILSEYEQCDIPLGMESGSISDRDLTCSSTHDITSVGPQMARIRTELEGGAWCPDKPIGPKSYEYIQIELHQLFFLNAIETQGRFDNGQGNEYAEYYQIQYQRDNNSSQWINYYNKKTNKTLIKGNINTYGTEKRFLLAPILAKRIRIIPFSSRLRTICMRVELYGCPFYGGIISYTTTPSLDKDNLYDGGIGKLTDGIIGGSENTYLVWNKSPVSIRFQFDITRYMKIIRIYSMNNKYRSIEIKFDQSTPIKHSISPIATSLSTVFVDMIDFNQYEQMFIAKEVEIRFEFDNGLLFLTEITFDNQPAMMINTTISTNANCPIGCSIVNQNLTVASSSTSTIFPFEWFTISIILSFFLCFLCLLILFIYRIRHCYLRKNLDVYYKCSQTNDSSVQSTEQNQLTKKSNYDDITSMGSYIYPITSTTSLLHTSSPSSFFKSEQYAMIDGNWPMNNTVHYASSEIVQTSSKLISVFNCIPLQEVIPSKPNYLSISSVDPSKLFSLCKISQSKYGEIFLGKYQSKSVLIKMIRTNSIDSTRERFLSEINVLSRLNHVNLACLCALQSDSLYVIQEHSDLGTLQDYLHTQSNDSTFQKLNIYFSHQLANALEYLYNLNIIHGDIATRNCLFYSNLTIKLTDCAMALAQYEHEYWICTNGEKIPLRWNAPEALTNNSTLKSDIYSFAVTLWECWSRCSYLPHVSLTNEELYQCLVLQQSSYHIGQSHKCMFRLSQPSDCPKEIYDLLCECWHIDGTKRPNISDIALYFRRQINLS